MHSLFTTFAEGTDDVKNVITTQLPQTDTNTILTNAINLIFLLIGAGAVIMIVYSGFQMTTSAGNPGAVAKAKNTLVFSIIGLVLALSAYAIVKLIIEKF